MNKYLFLAIINGVMLLGCSDNQGTTGEANGQDSTQTANAFEVIFHEDKAGKPAEANYYVSIKYALTNEKGDTIASTYRQGMAFDILLEPLNEQDLIFKLLTQMSEGDSASFITNAQTYFRSEGLKLPDSIEADTRYEFRAKLLKVQTPDEKLRDRRIFEDQVLLKHMQQNYPQAMRDDKSGLYLVYEKKGQGQPAQIRDSVRFRYVTKQLDNSILDSSDGQEVGVTLGERGIIAGWMLAFTKFMNVGTKVTLFLPSHLAFGAKPKQLTYKNQTSNLGPFTVLKCELELTKIYRPRQ